MNRTKLSVTQPSSYFSCITWPIKVASPLRFSLREPRLLSVYLSLAGQSLWHEFQRNPQIFLCTPFCKVYLQGKWSKCWCETDWVSSHGCPVYCCGGTDLKSSGTTSEFWSSIRSILLSSSAIVDKLTSKAVYLEKSYSLLFLSRVLFRVVAKIFEIAHFSSKSWLVYGWELSQIGFQ